MSIKHLTDPEFIAGKKTQWNKFTYKQHKS